MSRPKRSMNKHSIPTDTFSVEAYAKKISVVIQEIEELTASLKARI